MTNQAIDPVTGAARPIRGAFGRVSFVPPPDGSAITPDDGAIYDPPIQVWIGDVASLLITVMPYGLGGDALVQYPTKFGLLLPVMVKRVMATGTTATILRGQSAYVDPPSTGAFRADSTLITADDTTVTADSF